MWCMILPTWLLILDMFHKEYYESLTNGNVGNIVPQTILTVVALWGHWESVHNKKTVSFVKHWWKNGDQFLDFKVIE